MGTSATMDEDSDDQQPAWTPDFQHLEDLESRFTNANFTGVTRGESEVDIYGYREDLVVKESDTLIVPFDENTRAVIKCRKQVGYIGCTRWCQVSFQGCLPPNADAKVSARRYRYEDINALFADILEIRNAHYHRAAGEA